MEDWIDDSSDGSMFFKMCVTYFIKKGKPKTVFLFPFFYFLKS